MKKTIIFRTCGRPNAGSGEKARDTKVQARKSPIGTAMRGHFRGIPDRRRTPRASASSTCETAMESRIATADASASQRLSFFRKGGGTNACRIDDGMWRAWVQPRKPHFGTGGFRPKPSNLLHA